MKKLFIIFAFLLSTHSSYWYLSDWSCDNVLWVHTELGRIDKYWVKTPIECWENYYSIRDNKCYYIKEAKTGKVVKSFCDKSYFNFSKQPLNTGQFKSLKVDLMESKYNNHIFYSVDSLTYNVEQKNIVGKKEEFLWWYLDGKRIFAFASFDSKLETIWYLWNFNYIRTFSKFDEYYPTNNERYEHWTIKAPVLSKKSQDRLNKFIAKIWKEKYIKVYSKIDEIRKNYTNMDLYRHRFIKEVLDYIYFEMKVKELMSKKWVSGYMKYHPDW